MNTELFVVISDREMLSINGCDRNSELVGVDLGQLRNVRCVGTTLVKDYFVMNLFDYVDESLEIRYSQVSADGFVDENSTGIDSVMELS